jgi:hypothetical protein
VSYEIWFAFGGLMPFSSLSVQLKQQNSILEVSGAYLFLSIASQVVYIYLYLLIIIYLPVSNLSYFFGENGKVAIVVTDFPLLAHNLSDRNSS